MVVVGGRSRGYWWREPPHLAAASGRRRDAEGTSERRRDGACGGLFFASSGQALAHQCCNVSKNEQNPGAGAQVVIDDEDNIVFATNGLINRVDRGLVDPESGEGYHGVVAFDVDGDGEADFSTYQVTPGDEIPPQAQQNGSPDDGIVNVCDAGLC